MTDVIIIGAGIVGLATAYQLLQLNPNLKVIVLEKECKAALHQSSRNSGVIHSGVYYKPNSLKAINCVGGKKQMIDFAENNGIEMKELGKVIVATDLKQVSYLEELYQRGQKNQVDGVELIDSDKLKEIEPNVTAIKAVWIPKVRVIRFKDVAIKLAEHLVAHGSKVLYNQKALKIYPQKDGVVVEAQHEAFHAKKVINCAGLFSDKFIELKKQYRIVPFRGEYYEIKTGKKDLINGLVYPVKDPRFPFLGVHLTKTIDGSLEAGPNAVLAFAREGYRKKDISFTDLKNTLTYQGFWKMTAKHWKIGLYEFYRSCFKSMFLKDLQKLVPCLEKSDLKRSFSGIRAQVVLKDGTLPDDFIFEKNGNILHVVNAPSPAATASFSIGMSIAKKVLEI